jgi:hypothetical protein
VEIHVHEFAHSHLLCPMYILVLGDHAYTSANSEEHNSFVLYGMHYFI